MRVQHIALELESGRSAVMHLVLDDGQVRREATPETINAEIAKGVLKVKSWRLVDAEEAARISASLRQPAGPTSPAPST